MLATLILMAIAFVVGMVVGAALALFLGYVVEDDRPAATPTTPRNPHEYSARASTGHR